MFRFLRRASFLTGNQRYKAHKLTKRSHGLAVDHADELQLLRVGRSDRNDHSSSVAELSGQSRRQMESGGRNEDGVKRSAVRKSERAIADDDMDIAIAKRREKIAGALGERHVPFDGKHFCSKFREQRGSVAGTGSDLENLVVRRDLERFEHERNNIRLRNGLAVTDGKRMIFVGLRTVCFRDKFVPRYAKHGVKNARIGDAAIPELRIDHQSPSSGRIRHKRWFSGR
jgi:hypothetical protein